MLKYDTVWRSLRGTGSRDHAAAQVEVPNAREWYDAAVENAPLAALADRQSDWVATHCSRGVGLKVRCHPDVGMLAVLYFDSRDDADRFTAAFGGTRRG